LLASSTEIKPTVENVDQAASSYVKDAKNKWESPGSPYGLRTSLNSIGLKKKKTKQYSFIQNTKFFSLQAIIIEHNFPS
jgi:hypothetical protein